MPPLKNLVQLKKYSDAGYPLIYILSDEEERVIEHLNVLRKKLKPPLERFLIWSVTEGLCDQQTTVPDTRELHDALKYIIQNESSALYLFKDIHRFLNDHIIIREIRDVYQYLQKNKGCVFFLSPEVALPRELHHQVLTYNFLPPETGELRKLLDTYISRLNSMDNIEVMLTDEEKQAFVQGLKGLTYDEAIRALRRTFLGQSLIDGSLIENIYEEKQQYCRKTGVLEFVPPHYDIEEVGGLKNLKSWLDKRKKIIQQQTTITDTVLPRGILLMGISGCGKSLAVKAISSVWELPLFRLDMNLVFSGIFGTPEESFDKSLKMCDTLAPMLLWIDEIEMGIGGYKAGTSGPNARIFASFLTWLQEHESLVFVAATANRVDLLPAEILRKGRFDQVFFVDLPSDQERVDILKIHFATRQVDLGTFNYESLAKLTLGWNGAELEQAVISALVDAQNETRNINQQDMLSAIGKIVPLSKTMSEQVKYIRRWAMNRAFRASPQE